MYRLFPSFHRIRFEKKEKRNESTRDKHFLYFFLSLQMFDLQVFYTRSRTMYKYELIMLIDSFSLIKNTKANERLVWIDFQLENDQNVTIREQFGTNQVIYFSTFSLILLYLVYSLQPMLNNNLVLAYSIELS